MLFTDYHRIAMDLCSRLKAMQPGMLLVLMRFGIRIMEGSVEVILQLLLLSSVHCPAEHVSLSLTKICQQITPPGTIL
jgi:hypothetical protein